MAAISYEERLKWFHEARFGLFIHFGLYSLLQRGEWVMEVEKIPADEYAKLAGEFSPKKFNADAIMAMAKDAGMKYAVMTTRHHDGFCLYDSDISDFTSVKTRAKRDLIAEFIEAARKAGIKVGLYYSWLDWRFPGYHDPKGNPESAKAMVEQAHIQIQELVTKYGKIDYLWYDGHWVPGIEDGERAAFWGAKEVDAMVRKLQPHILINNRSGLDEDVDTPEQHVTASKPGRAWESCMTMGDSCGWGYIANNPNFKTTTQLIQHLVTAAAGEGNFLLNIGPKPDGSIRKRERTRLAEMGKWVRANGESIYGSSRYSLDNPLTATGIGSVGMVGLATRKGSNVYVHAFRWPPQGEICIPRMEDTIKSATVLGSGEAGKIVKLPDGRTIIRGLPKSPPNGYDTVVRLEIVAKP